MKNGKYCILIADDEKEIRDILRLLLEGEGYAVLTAEDGREAIAEAAAQTAGNGTAGRAGAHDSRPFA